MADGNLDIGAKPTRKISVRETFKIDSDMEIMGFAQSSDRVPDIDSTGSTTTPRSRSSPVSPITAAS
jgi:hypothetical protein